MVGDLQPLVAPVLKDGHLLRKCCHAYQIAIFRVCPRDLPDSAVSPESVKVVPFELGLILELPFGVPLIDDNIAL